MRTFLIVIFMALSFIGHSLTKAELETIINQKDALLKRDKTNLSFLLTNINQKDAKSAQELNKIQFFINQKEEKFLYVFLEPKTSKGSGYLAVDGNVWNYDAGSRKFVFESARNRLGNSQTSTNDFLEENMLDSYEIVSFEDSTLGNLKAIKIEFKAKTGKSPTYPRVVIWLGNDENYYMLKKEEYSLSNRLSRTSEYASYTKLPSGVGVARRTRFTDNITGGKTLNTIEEIAFKDIPDSVFNKSYLERISQ